MLYKNNQTGDGVKPAIKGITRAENFKIRLFPPMSTGTIVNARSMPTRNFKGILSTQRGTMQLICAKFPAENAVIIVNIQKTG